MIVTDRMKRKNRPFHVPILLNEVIAWIKVSKDHWYVDTTCGGGGHTKAILVHGGRVVAIDTDPATIRRLQNQFKGAINQGRLKLIQNNFAHLKSIIDNLGLDKVSGVIFDLGISTWQLARSGRGFSFMANESLDMRLSNQQKLTADQVINDYSTEQLTEIFQRFGEENLATAIAEEIVKSRKKVRITTTEQLRYLISHVYRRYRRYQSQIDPATKVFQALRIVVNDELTNLRSALPQAFEILLPGGRLVVISFHSLEDRIVKQYFSQLDRNNQAFILTPKPVTPKPAEISQNRAARSAKLRVIEKMIN